MRSWETEEAGTTDIVGGDMGWERRRTVIDYDGDRALGSNLRPERLQSIPVVDQRARKVPTADDDGVVRASLCSLFAQLDGLTRGTRSSASDDGHGGKAGLIESMACLLDQGGTLAVREMVCLAHGSRQNRGNTGLRYANYMSCEALNVCRMTKQVNDYDGNWA